MAVDLAAIDNLWRQGKRKETIDRLLAVINSHRGAKPPLQAAIRFCYYLFLLGDYQACEKFLRELNAFYPGHPGVQENLAQVLVRRNGDKQEVVSLLEQVVAASPESDNAWDGLADAYATVGQIDKARAAGERSLLLKEKHCDAGIEPAVPSTASASSFDAASQGVDVVAFSLWGSNPRYLRGALRNALLAPDLLPGWTCRFYADETTPVEFRDVLTGLDAEVRLEPPGQSLRAKLGWRFKVANDLRVRRFLARDCDSVISVRETRAIDEWLESDRYFHVMRDWWTHTDLVLAGMWGGRAGVLPDLESALAQYRPKKMETPNVDQWFLREFVWPRIKNHCLIHDRCYRVFDAREWPSPTPHGNRHVGQNEIAADRARQEQVLGPWLSQPHLQ